MSIELKKYIACICEESAEEAIIDILLDNHLLVFDRSDMIDESVIRCRNARKFEEKYLGKGFDCQITILRILDSRRENFKFSKAYMHKVSVQNIITAPEIEILVILSEHKYKPYKSAGKKPSDYCKTNLGLANVKSRDFILDYFNDTDKLIKAILEYKRISNIPANEHSLADILK